MTTPLTVRSALTRNCLSTIATVRRSLSPADDAIEARIARFAEQARQDGPDVVEDLIEAWAEIQTEALMREIMSTPMSWVSRRPSDIDEYVAVAHDLDVRQQGVS